MAWIDFPATGLSSAQPLHAGATTEWWRGNIVHAFEQSGYDFQCQCHDGQIYYSKACGAANEWVVFDSFSPLPIPMRKKLSGDWREITVGWEIKTTAGAATVRTYLRSIWQEPDVMVVDATDGLIDETEYCENTTNSAVFEYNEDTVTPVNEVGRFIVPEDDFGLTDPHPMAWLSVIVKCTVAWASVYLRGPRVKEIVP